MLQQNPSDCTAWNPWIIDGTAMTDATLRLSLIQEHRILDQAAGLNEPSGLTLNHDGTA